MDASLLSCLHLNESAVALCLAWYLLEGLFQTSVMFAWLVTWMWLKRPDYPPLMFFQITIAIAVTGVRAGYALLILREGDVRSQLDVLLPFSISAAGLAVCVAICTLLAFGLECDNHIGDVDCESIVDAGGLVHAL